MSDWRFATYASELGLRVEAASPGHARLRCPWRAGFANMIGVAHGGVVTAVMDTACGVALTADADGTRGDGRVVTVSLTANFLAPFREGDTLVAEAETAGGGRKLVTMRVRCARDDGTPVAVGQGVFRRLDR